MAVADPTESADGVIELVQQPLELATPTRLSRAALSNSPGCLTWLPHASSRSWDRPQLLA